MLTSVQLKSMSAPSEQSKRVNITHDNRADRSSLQISLLLESLSYTDSGSSAEQRRTIKKFRSNARTRKNDVPRFPFL